MQFRLHMRSSHSRTTPCLQWGIPSEDIRDI